MGDAMYCVQFIFNRLYLIIIDRICAFCVLVCDTLSISLLGFIASLAVSFYVRKSIPQTAQQ